MTAKILLLRRENYEQKEINSAVDAIFEHFGGVGRFIEPDASVLLKVNLVSGQTASRRVTTDPVVVRAVAQAVLKAGGRAVIADSPGIDSFGRAAKISGIADVANELGIPCEELTDPVRAGSRLELSNRVLTSDVVINLPKMKTHAQMLLTMGVKNMFGCVVGRKKAEWHYNVGLRRDPFAELLLDIWLAARPALTIMDGVWGMDGRGPTHGKPFPYGVVAGAEDALSLDFHLCKMMGVRLEDYPLWRAAVSKGLPQTTLSDDDIAGDFTPSHVWNAAIPKLDSLSVIPFLERGYLAKALTSRPVHIKARCLGALKCGKCVKLCAAKAIQIEQNIEQNIEQKLEQKPEQDHKKDKLELRFDYDKCIRCYCCHEMCPAGAIDFKEGLIMKAGKVISWIRDFLNSQNNQNS
ncbi:(4Fe-4S)-binding protein [Synergistales bacterium]|nr:(4Fe-4S)-binding protein [Synergistales bacterium]